MKTSNTEDRELSVKELDSISGGRIIGDPLIVFAVAAAASFRIALGSFAHLLAK